MNCLLQTIQVHLLFMHLPFPVNYDVIPFLVPNQSVFDRHTVSSTAGLHGSTFAAVENSFLVTLCRQMDTTTVS